MCDLSQANSTFLQNFPGWINLHTLFRRDIYSLKNFFTKPKPQYECRLGRKHMKVYKRIKSTDKSATFCLDDWKCSF